ncbi:unnamed protein product [Nyctereutes procyonoides]|uniref:Large ribosomal subunit protein uL29 n=1 Tax=Nyctereutes procyonoides TaxID=34880 RepID=A0A811ZE74_NYCPR|nr:unnamed protein product [Nyctereutes procyonoides]
MVDTGRLKVELSQLHIVEVTGGAVSKLSKKGLIHKSITYVLTIINQTQKENLRKFYQHKRTSLRYEYVAQEDRCLAS